MHLRRIKHSRLFDYFIFSVKIKYKMSEISLKIPIGDALDKLSILKIKLIKIDEEEKRCEVLKELTLIENLLQEYERKYEFHFKK